MKLLALIFASVLFSSNSAAQWQKFDVGTDSSFRGLDVVSANVVWASGTGGTVVRTIDGGKNWDVIKVKGAEKLDFRDIEAFDANTAYILSIGNGENSRIYKTINGGKDWKLQFKNNIEKAFFDSITFWDSNNGMAQSDPVDGKYVLYRTTDGENWIRVDTSQMPAAKNGEAAFGASRTRIVTYGKNRIWLITGGMDARVFYSKNRGKTWRAYDTPMVKGTAGSGIFGIAMRDRKRGVIVGGNYEKPKEINNNLAFTKNGGKTWSVAKGLNGYRSGAIYLRRDGSLKKDAIIAVGPTGSDISRNGGKTWQALDQENFNVIQNFSNFSIWAAGPKGSLAKLNSAVVLNMTVTLDD